MCLLVLSIIRAVGGLITMWSTGLWFRRQTLHFWPRNQEPPLIQTPTYTNSQDVEAGNPSYVLSDMAHSEPTGAMVQQQLKNAIQSLKRDQESQARKIEWLKSMMIQSVSVGQEDQ